MEMHLCTTCGYPNKWVECTECFDEKTGSTPIRLQAIYKKLREVHKHQHPIRWVFQGVVDNLRDVDLISDGVVPTEFHDDYRKGNPLEKVDEEFPAYPSLRKGYAVRAVTNSVYNCTYCMMEPAMGSYKTGKVKWAAQALVAFDPPLLLMCEEHWFDFIKENQPSR